MAFNINGITPKKILFNGLNVAKLIYNNVLLWQSSLPSEYQQVEYIEATGTQYLEINYIASNITSSKGAFQLTDISTGAMLFGSRTSAQSNAYGFNWGGNEQPYRYYNTFYMATTVNGITDKEIDLEKHTFEKLGVELYIDDEFISSRSQYVSTTFETPYKMIVFGCNTKGTIGLFASAKMYNLQFYDNDILKVDLVPCYRKSDNVIGMYDMVTGTFYTNKGTGTFLKGENIYSGEPTFSVYPLDNYGFTNITRNSDVISFNYNGTSYTINIPSTYNYKYCAIVYRSQTEIQILTSAYPFSIRSTNNSNIMTDSTFRVDENNDASPWTTFNNKTAFNCCKIAYSLSGSTWKQGTTLKMASGGSYSSSSAISNTAYLLYCDNNIKANNDMTDYDYFYHN